MSLLFFVLCFLFFFCSFFVVKANITYITIVTRTSCCYPYYIHNSHMYRSFPWQGMFVNIYRVLQIGGKTFKHTKLYLNVRNICNTFIFFSNSHFYFQDTFFCQTQFSKQQTHLTKNLTHTKHKHTKHA